MLFRSKTISGTTIVGREAEDHAPDIVLYGKHISLNQGVFKLVDDHWVYQNRGEETDTWVNGQELTAGYGVRLTNNTHLLISHKRASRDEDLVSILFTNQSERANTPWEIFDKKDRKHKHVVAALEAGSSYSTPNETFIKHFNTCAHQTFTESTDAEVSDLLSIRIRQRLGDEKGSSRILIKNINLDIAPSEMVLVIGGSGAGKTTFLNAVSGYEKADASITYKGIDLYQDSEQVRRLVRLVPQFDTLRDADTVMHTLRDVAQIQLPAQITSNRKTLDKKVLSVLDTFGLTEEKGNFVRKLSGGQRKRLSIATEYISEPEIFFLDEPDSGLDAGSAESVMRQVRSIVDEGKISIVISHSPDRVAPLCDKILVIAKDSVDNCGQMAFYGSIGEAYPFFEVRSLENIVKKISQQEQADSFIQRFSGEVKSAVCEQ